jgi:hypothetical protein
MINYKFIETIGEIIDELVIERDINNNQTTSFEVLEIYFNRKSFEDKERILQNALFGC